MSIVFHRQQDAVIGNSGTKETALKRYESERDAATASIQHLQASGVVTKGDWLEFSERIRIAAERFLKENDDASIVEPVELTAA